MGRSGVFPPRAEWPPEVRQAWEYLQGCPWAAFLPKMQPLVDLLDAYFESVSPEAYWASLSVNQGIPRHLHRPQFEFIMSPSRERWLLGANRVGKSLITALEYAWAANGVHPNPERRVEPPPVQIWAGCPDWQNHGRPITQNLIRWALGRNSGNWKWLEAQRTFKIRAAGSIGDAPSEIVIKSYDSGAPKWQGAAPYLIGFDEVPPQDIYRESSVRIGSGILQIIGAMTPVYQSAWFISDVYEPWRDEAEPEDKAFIDGEMKENPNLDPDEVARVEREYRDDPEEYQIRIKGQWRSVGGRIYSMLKAGIHVVSDFEIPGVHRPADEKKNEVPWTLFRAIDPGIRVPTAVLWVAVAPNGLCFIYRELYETDLSIPEVCARIRQFEFPEEKIHTSIIDPAASQRDLADGTRRIDTFAQNGIFCAPGNNDIEHGISRMRLAFSWDLDENSGELRRTPKYRFFRSCRNAWREHRRYAWKPHRRHSPSDPKDRPASKEDHTCDALRYLEATGVGPVFVDPRRFNFEEAESYEPSTFTGY